MIKKLQRKIRDSGFVTNDPKDKLLRYDITAFLNECLESYGNETMLRVIDRFSLVIVQRDISKIGHKISYFKKIIKEFIAEDEIPDIEFPETIIDEETIKYTIIRIIEKAAITKSEEPHFNPITDVKWLDSPFDDVAKELYDQAYQRLYDDDYFFKPLIEKALALSNHTDKEFIKEELDYIYKELDKYSPDYAYEKLIDSLEDIKNRAATQKK
ncbi:MAG: hypothetical protein M0Q41_13420 [Bacteroidales bacterium]|nr:hypothetical protein [Bacteroidales bacterium]